MSCVVKTQTPFISKEILLEALEKCGYEYNIKSGKIHIPALHMYRNTYFQFIGGKYVLSHEDFNFYIDSFLKQLEASYNNIYEMKHKRLKEIEKEKAAILERKRLEKEKAEKLKKEEAERLEKQGLKEEAQILERERIEREELERLEKERLAYVESQKKAIMEKAKAKGYRVVEVKKENKIQLTLVREVR